MGVKSPCSKGPVPALLSVWSLSEDNQQNTGFSVRYALVINWFSQYALNSYLFVFFFFKQKEKKSLNPPFPSTAGGECVGVL